MALRIIDGSSKEFYFIIFLQANRLEKWPKASVLTTQDRMLRISRITLHSHQLESLIKELFTGHSIVFNIFIVHMHLIDLISWMWLFYSCNSSVWARKTLNKGKAVILIDRIWKTVLSDAKGLCMHAKFVLL